MGDASDPGEIRTSIPLMRVALAIVALLAISAQATALTTLPPPAGGRAVLPDEAAESLRLRQKHGGTASLRIESVKKGPFAKQAVVEVDPSAGQQDAVALAIDTDAAINHGDVLLLRVWLAAKDKGQAHIVLQPETDSAPPILDRAWKTDRPGWRCVNIPFVCRHRLPAGKGSVELRLDGGGQTLAAGGLQLINYGKSLTMDQLIEQIGRGDLQVEVRDSEGQPVAGAQVEVEMTHTPYGFVVKVDEPIYEGIALRGGHFGVPHLVALKPVDGEDVKLTDVPLDAEVKKLLPGYSRNRRRNRFSGVPRVLRKLRTVTIDRGERENPGRGFKIKVDRAVEAYLFVHDLGDPSLSDGWRRTTMSASWASGDYTFTDHVYVQRFPAGEITVPEHDGSDQSQWWTRQTGTTDSAGDVSVQGYVGSYRIRATVSGKMKITHGELTGEQTRISVQMDP